MTEPHCSPDMGGCPFCGSKDVELSATASHWPAVGCNECGALGPCTDLHSDKAIEAWNARAGVAQSSAQMSERINVIVRDYGLEKSSASETHDALIAVLSAAQGYNATQRELEILELRKLASHWKERHDEVLQKHIECCGVAQAAAPSTAWRCFHCDEVFTDPKAAANHFGVDHVGNETLCQMAQVDGGIARVIADLADELQRYRMEDNTSYREFYALGADHRAALIKEEQKGYDRGLADARADASPVSSTDSGGK